MLATSTPRCLPIGLRTKKQQPNQWSLSGETIYYHIDVETVTSYDLLISLKTRISCRIRLSERINY